MGSSGGCCVEWPRYMKRERRDRYWLGGQLLFFEETSLVVLNLRCERGMEGRLQSEPMGG